MKTKKFSIIIPTCHRNDMLAQCLERISLNRKEVSTDLFEVIVTDDGKKSTAKVMIKEKFPWVHWIQGCGKGPAANRNNGVKMACGTWLIFTDDDCLPDTWWIKEYNEAINVNPQVKVFEGKTYADIPKKSFNEVSPVNEKGGNMPSCNFMILKDSFLKLGGFDENFKFYFEDMDLSYRIKKAVIPSVFVPKASVCHPWRRVDAKKFWKNRNFYKNSYWNFITKDEDLFKTHSPLFFLKQIIKDIVFDTLVNLYRFRGRGILYNLSHRAVHLELLLKRTLLSQKEFYEIQKQYHLNQSFKV